MHELGKSPLKLLHVEQTLASFGAKIGADGKLVRLDGSCIKRNPAYKEWLYRLKPGERLPRGRYFRNKKPGRPFIIVDEFHHYVPPVAKGWIESIRAVNTKNK